MIHNPISHAGRRGQACAPWKPTRCPTCQRPSGWCAASWTGRMPLIGFAGAPFHAGQLPDRGRAPSRDYRRTKQMMYAAARPGTPSWHIWPRLRRPTCGPRFAPARRPSALRLLGRLPGTRRLPALRAALLSAGLFRVVRQAGVPAIHFGTGTATLLALLREAGGDVIGLDWRIPLDEGVAQGGSRSWPFKATGPGGALRAQARAEGPGGRRPGARRRTSRAHLQPGPRYPAADAGG